ncbi:MAG TPA: GNAT family N-acetyltransferase [Candidatus Limiplasma sp.]|nr:GNAT family N-acetyltransferase [Candidatus Limiplasma sp.]
MDVKIDLTNTIIQTDRLTLRPLAHEDLDDFYAYASEPGVGERAGWKHHESIEESAKILQMLIDEKSELALFHKADQKMIGTLGMHPSWARDAEEYRSYKMTEIGYVLSKEYWGQGLMPEAVKAAVHYCFTELNLDAVACGHFVENNQSRRVIEKCGFQFVRVGKYTAKQLQREYDDMQYILFRETDA